MNLENNHLSSLHVLLGQKRILSLAEVSIYTGLSMSWLYKLCQMGHFPHSKPNNKLIFCDREKVDQWLLSNPIVPAKNIEELATAYVANNPLKGGKI